MMCFSGRLCLGGEKCGRAKRILFGVHEYGGGGFSVSLGKRTEAACFFAVKTTKGGEIAAFNGSFKVCPDLLSVFRAAAAALTPAWRASKQGR